MADFLNHKIKITDDEAKYLMELLRQAEQTTSHAKRGTNRLGNMYNNAAVRAAANNSVYGGNVFNIPSDRAAQIYRDDYTLGKLGQFFSERAADFGDNATTAFQYKFRDSQVNPEFIKALIKNQDEYFGAEDLGETLRKAYGEPDYRGFLEHLANRYETDSDFRDSFKSDALDNRGGILAWYDDFKYQSEGANKLDQAAKAQKEVKEQSISVPTYLKDTSGDTALMNQYNQEDKFNRVGKIVEPMLKNRLGYLR